jgi:hypothetical protein
MNKYLTKIAINWTQERKVAGEAGKAILGDKVGDVLGLAAGNFVGRKFDKEHRERDGLIGASVVGSGLMYRQLRGSLLKGKH